MILAFVTYVLAVWRLSHMLVKEPGPGDVMANFRDFLVQTDWTPEWWAEASQCVSCASVWVAGLLLIVDRTPLRWLRWVLAGSAVAKLLEDYFYESAGTVLGPGEEEERLPFGPDSRPAFDLHRLLER